MGGVRLRGDGSHWPDRGARRVTAGGREQGGLADQPDAAGPDARAQFLRPSSDTDAVGLSDREEQPDAVPHPNAISDPVTFGQSIGYRDRGRFVDALATAVCCRGVIGVGERQRDTFGLALNGKATSVTPAPGDLVKDRRFESVLSGLTTAKRNPDRSRLIGATRGALVVQVAAMVVAIMLASPDFIDRLLRPTICTGCWDFRGLAFVLWIVFFTAAALALMVVAWALRHGRIWPSWLALAVDLVVLGLTAYSLVLAVTGHWGTYDYAPPVPVQILQAFLVLVSDLLSLLLLVRLLNAVYGSPDRLLQLTRNVLVAQVLGMVACIALASPSLSDRLFNGYNGGDEGLAFALWTALLAPAGLVILAAAWRLCRRPTSPRLAACRGKNRRARGPGLAG